MGGDHHPICDCNHWKADIVIARTVVPVFAKVICSGALAAGAITWLVKLYADPPPVGTRGGTVFFAFDRQRKRARCPVVFSRGEIGDQLRIAASAPLVQVVDSPVAVVVNTVAGSLLHTGVHFRVCVIAVTPSVEPSIAIIVAPRPTRLGNGFIARVCIVLGPIDVADFMGVRFIRSADIWIVIDTERPSLAAGVVAIDLSVPIVVAAVETRIRVVSFVGYAAGVTW